MNSYKASSRRIDRTSLESKPSSFGKNLHALGANQFRDVDDPKLEFSARILPLSTVTGSTFKTVIVKTPAFKSLGPLIVSCPHAGRIYPFEFVSSAKVEIDELRGLEDFATDQIVRSLFKIGVTTVTQCLARAYLDVNRATNALDQSMFRAKPSIKSALPTRLVQAGYGLLPRLTAERMNIYGSKLNPDEAIQRIEICHKPYHDALHKTIDIVLEKYKNCVLIDCHSMPPNDQLERPLADIILGDLHHNTLDRNLGNRLQEHIVGLGYSAVWNLPYAGGYITKKYGRMNSRVQTVQIEINRKLYMDNGLCINDEGLRRIQTLFQSICTFLRTKIEGGFS